VLAACTFDMDFCYVLSRWEGSTNTNWVLEDALTKDSPLLDGKYYLADAGYGRTLHTLTRIEAFGSI
jgi:hypothetical protein